MCCFATEFYVEEPSKELVWKLQVLLWSKTLTSTKKPIYVPLKRWIRSIDGATTQQVFNLLLIYNLFLMASAHIDSTSCSTILP